MREPLLGVRWDSGQQQLGRAQRRRATARASATRSGSAPAAATASIRAVDPVDPNVDLRRSRRKGALRAWTARTRESKGIRPTGEAGRAGLALQLERAAADLAARQQDAVFRRERSCSGAPNRGDCWDRVGADLTRADRATAADHGRHRSTAATAGTRARRSSATSPRSTSRRYAKGVLYTGSDDGIVAVSRDGGANWTKVEQFPGVPDTDIREPRQSRRSTTKARCTPRSMDIAATTSSRTS